MYCERVLYPVETLGPGKRVGIWLAGCRHRCEECCNSELWEQKPSQKITVSALVEMIKKVAISCEIDGFTITGGDPMEQREELRELIKALKKISADILVYTGYKRDEIDGEYLEGISVLIDGRYEREKNDGCLLRGSSNQIIHYLDTSVKKKYEEYLKVGVRQVQNFTTSRGIVSVGIHGVDFKSRLDCGIAEKGVKKI